MLLNFLMVTVILYDTISHKREGFEMKILLSNDVNSRSRHVQFFMLWSIALSLCEETVYILRLIWECILISNCMSSVSLIHFHPPVKYDILMLVNICYKMIILTLVGL